MAKLYFKYGAMGCGKTREIVKVWHNYKDKQRRAVIMKSTKDTKGGKNIKSRDNSELPVDFLITKDDNIYQIISMYIIDNIVDVILVDEAEFLTEQQIQELADIVDELGIPVMCFGLKTDFQDKLFPGSAALFAKADDIEKMKTICICGKEAECNVRFVDGKPVFEGEQVAIDGENKTTYESMCRKCRKKLYKEWKGRK